MAAPLRCPLCGADLDFAAWRASASCGACGVRVRFEEALAAGALAPPPEAPPGAAPPAQTALVTPRERTLFGKPRRWTAAWSVVLAIWILAALGLAAVRVDMGHLTVLNAREEVAVQEVQGAELQPGVTNEQALAKLSKRFGQPGQRGFWNVQDRHWEHRLYVWWELGDYRPLSWTVGYGGEVKADAETRRVLDAALRAPTPSPVLPSLPPGF